MADLKLIKTRDAGAAGSTVVLCATRRLARNLRAAHDRVHGAAGLARWSPLQALTVPQWLDGVIDEALLMGELPAAAAPSLVLTPMQERVLWERVIAADADGAAEALFFDSAGLANAAAAANALIESWGLRVAGDAAALGEEVRRFLHWRAEFRRHCEAAGWREPARAVVAQIAAIAAGAGRLPPRLLLAGFDRYTCQEQRLAEALRGRGCAVAELELGAETDAVAGAVVLPDRHAECRAAAAWAAARLAREPQLRLGIVVPELAAWREQLAAALDEALDPQTLAAAQAEMPRRYNFSLGTALSRQPLVDTALRLLRLAAAARRLEQAAVGELLRGAYWSADESEADVRARCEARLRERLAPAFSFDGLLRFLRRQKAVGLAAPRLLGHLEALRAKAAAQPARRLPSQWASSLRELIHAAGWPGERSLSSHEFQARVAFAEVLDSLAQFDGLLGRIALAEAVSRLAQLCRERVFQPETANDPPVQVMGPLEAAGARFDALWVMGMNDDVWPAAANPNPLLPAELQRRAGTPGASSEVEAAFAQAIHRRLLKSAPEVLFSWAQAEGDRVRRPSPLIAALPPHAAPTLAPTLAERLCGTLPQDALDDNRAPLVAPGERIGGGANLLKAQALCPAWAYYRYRLGARALGAPADGLDALARGSLLHAVLEAFWRGRGSADLLALAADELAAALGAAVDQALAAFDAVRDEALPPTIALLERERLMALVGRWLEIEAARPAAFRVVACEERHELDIDGLVVRLSVDRIDELSDGRRIVLDYKTGRELDWASWAAPRLAEPQLPLYAAYLAGAAGVDAVAFAQVRAGDEGFVGIAAEAGLLPAVAGLDEKGGRRRFDEATFPNWQSLLDHWRRAIAEIAGEVREGVAAVVFENEKALDHCEVKPLLRLAERRSQQESAQ